MTSVDEGTMRDLLGHLHGPVAAAGNAKLDAQFWNLHQALGTRPLADIIRDAEPLAQKALKLGGRAAVAAGDLLNRIA